MSGFHSIRLRRDTDMLERVADTLVVEMNVGGAWLELIRAPTELKRNESFEISAAAVEVCAFAAPGRPRIARRE